MAFPGERVFDSTPPIRFYVEEADRPSTHLIVAFSAFSALGSAPAYHYVRHLRAYPHVHRLWILDEGGPLIDGERTGSYYLGAARDLAVDRATRQLIAAEQRRLGITAEDTVAIGSSKGGTAALWFGLQLGLGHVVAGGPQIRIGHYLARQCPAPYDEVARHIAGGTTDADIAFLDDLVPAALRASDAACDLRIHVGRGDPHWPQHVEPFAELAEAVGRPLRLDVAEYAEHAALGVHFPPYLDAQLGDLVGAPRHGERDAGALSS